MTLTRTATQSDERGIALIMALFMVLAMSVLGTSLMFMSQSETWSSVNYKLASQARYGAESGIHRAANFLLNSYTAPTNTGSTPNDPLNAYDITGPTVKYNNAQVRLSSDATYASNYGNAAVVTAFQNALATNGMALDTGSVKYKVRAELISMQTYPEAMQNNTPKTIQTWEITSVGFVEGPRQAQVEVSAVIEKQLVPLYRYAAFARHDGCAALSFAGGATTDSYDMQAGNPVFFNDDGNVGTNGNLTEAGSGTVINGTLSTPRSGVGNCTANNVTAQTINGGASVSDGLVELAQNISYPNPTLSAPPIWPSNQSLGGSCIGIPMGAGALCASAGNVAQVMPQPNTTVRLGDVDVSGGTLRLAPGKYVVNKLNVGANGRIEINPPGSVTIEVAGQGVADNQAAIDMTSSSADVNPSLDSGQLQLVYGGTAEVRLRGNARISAVIYAPNASTSFTGQGCNNSPTCSGFYGALITKVLTATGGATIHYDRRLQRTMMTAGENMMSAFTWKSF